MDFTVIIPVFNEALTIGKVLEAVLAAKEQDQRIKEVIVVDDGSVDETWQVVKAYGVTLVRLEVNKGKGAALTAGVRAAQTTGVLFIDGDLIGLTPRHLSQLIDPVADGSARMTLGIFKSGRIATDLAQQVAPDITGQRAMRKDDFLLVKGLERTRYGVDIALTNFAHKMCWPIKKVPLSGVTQVMKEEKYGLIKGTAARLRMYLDILRNIRV
ncbi:MAG: glycosyltransferase family 2 protein [Firmicutes bacterium]|nr:glycosyltransferase family 2 protein [Bacillota bacterium]